MNLKEADDEDFNISMSKQAYQEIAGELIKLREENKVLTKIVKRLDKSSLTLYEKMILEIE